METVRVKASRDYDVHIGRGLLYNCGSLISGITPSRRCALITDSNVKKLYADRVVKSLKESGFSVCVYDFPAGEKSKNLVTYAEIVEFLASKKITRSDCVIALGGGVTGDMAGFAAATYQRGVDFIQLPTTLLAASDSSVGGKTAVDLFAGKNLAGAFWPPRLVVCDCDTFDTLSPEIMGDGMAETIKHGLIADADFFQSVMDGSVSIEQMVRRNVEIKAAVVGEDEFEHGRRKILNFGHTLGHAVEKCSGYAVSHGHAVAIGMVLASRAAERLGYSPKGILKAVLPANERYGLPSACEYDAQQLFDAAAGDKKRDGGSIDLVVLEEIGRAKTVRVDMDGLRAFVEAAL